MAIDEKAFAKVWKGMPCAVSAGLIKQYIEAYDAARSAGQAEKRGWPCEQISVEELTRQPDGSALLTKLAAIHDKLLTGPSVQNRIMRAWDSARAIIAEGDDSDLPRSIFESAIEDIQDDVEECMKLVSATKREFSCFARTSTADPPQDCDWPFCHCDPKAMKVIEALEESGFRIERPESGWQPIETAPKDGTVLLLHFDYDLLTVVGYYGDKLGPERLTGKCCWRCKWDEEVLDEPTHWTHLPPPTTSIEGGKS